MIFHFLFIYTFEKSSIHTEILAILIVSHIAHHVHYTGNFKRRKSEYHGDMSVNFFPVADTGHDLCLFSNLRQQWIPDRLVVIGHFHLTYFKRWSN